LPEPLTVRRLEFVSLLEKGDFHLQAISLYDQRTGASTVVPVDQRFELLASGDLKLYQLTTAQPRLSLEHGYEVEADERAALEALRGDRATLLLAKEPVWGAAPSEPEQPDGIEVLTAEPERLRLRVHTSRPALLYQRETYFPGWKVWIDSQPREILLANGLFRAIPVTTGTHVLELRYEPAAVQLGIGISLASLAGVAFVLAVVARQKRR
jgi:hypothetical protein